MGLIVVGCGAFAAELAMLAKNTLPDNLTIKGFLAGDTPSTPMVEPIIGTVDDYQPQPDDRFICAIGDPKARLRLSLQLEAKGAIFINFIHPKAWVCDSAILGVGNIIYPDVIVSNQAKIGNHSVFLFKTTIGHNTVIGNGTTISCYCDITGHSQIGNTVFLGSHVSVIPKTQIADNVVVGAGSAVMFSIDSACTMVGVPAKKIL